MHSPQCVFNGCQNVAISLTLNYNFMLGHRVFAKFNRVKLAFRSAVNLPGSHMNIYFLYSHTHTCMLFTRQVETVGDKYMAVSGLPDHCEDHAKCMARVALDMMDMAKNVKMGSNPVVS